MVKFHKLYMIPTYDRCRIIKKAQIIKNLSQTAFHKVFAVSLNATTDKIERFHNGLWGVSPPLHLLAVKLIEMIRS